MRRLIPLLLALAGCVAAAPDAPAVGLSNAPVMVDGQTFMVAIGPMGLGREPGQGGLTPVAGRAARVQGTDAALGQSDGLIAKRAATVACSDAGGRLNDRALGRYDGAGGWIFDGVCA